MTIFPFQINDAAHIYDRISRIRPSDVVEKEPAEPQDVVSISPEGKKKQIGEQTRGGAQERIRGAK